MTWHLRHSGDSCGGFAIFVPPRWPSPCRWQAWHRPWHEPSPANCLSCAPVFVAWWQVAHFLTPMKVNFPAAALAAGLAESSGRPPAQRPEVAGASPAPAAGGGNQTAARNPKRANPTIARIRVSSLRRSYGRDHRVRPAEPWAKAVFHHPALDEFDFLRACVERIHAAAYARFLQEQALASPESRSEFHRTHCRALPRSWSSNSSRPGWSSHGRRHSSVRRWAGCRLRRSLRRRLQLAWEVTPHSPRLARRSQPRLRQSWHSPNAGREIRTSSTPFPSLGP